LYSQYLSNEALEGFGDFKIGQAIHTVKYPDDLMLLDKEETVLQGMIERLIEIGRCYGMEMNVEKPNIMRISKQPSLIEIMTDQKQLENVEYLKYLVSMITDDARCTRETKSRIVMTTVAFNRKKAFSPADWTRN
jgi:hypothetical protein